MAEFELNCYHCGALIEPEWGTHVWLRSDASVVRWLAVIRENLGTSAANELVTATTEAGRQQREVSSHGPRDTAFFERVHAEHVAWLRRIKGEEGRED